MIDASQAQIAKNLWDQSRAAAVQAHESWALVMKSQKGMLDAMRGAGAPFAAAADQYDKLLDFQAQQYKAAMDFMDKLAAEYQQMVAGGKKK